MSSLLKSWEANAVAWLETLDQKAIASREIATNSAILKAVIQHSPERVLDLGCGEGWLSRTLARRGIDVVGVDGVAELISQAKSLGEADFYTISYDEIRAGALDQWSAFDLVVSNYALFEEAPLQALLTKMWEKLNVNGHLIVQTIHPHHPAFAAQKSSGWLTEDWQGMAIDFKQPFNWYFRTLEDWRESFTAVGFKHFHGHDVLHPVQGDPISIILSGVK